MLFQPKAPYPSIISHHKHFVKFLSVILIFTSVFACIPTFETFATTAKCDIEREDLDFYAKNNILFYCPRLKTAGGITCISMGAGGSGDNVSTVFGFLLESGYDKNAAAGITGNLMQESGGNIDPYIRQDGGQTSESWRAWANGKKTFSGGFGIAQWDFESRVEALQRFADEMHLPVVSLEVQLKFLLKEANTEYHSSPAQLNNLTLREATERFMRNFENPGNPQLDRRLAYANSVLGLTPSDPNFSTTCEESGSVDLESGGLTDAQASALMEVYRSCAQDTSISTGANCDGAWVDVPSDGPCVGGTFNNCSAFSQWFVNRYTTTKSSLFQGSQAATSLGVETGRVPKVYSVFSTGPYTGSADGWPNHTGVVLGIDESSDTLLIGEASCGSGFTASSPGIRKVSLSEWTNSASQYGPTYAYLTVKGL